LISHLLSLIWYICCCCQIIPPSSWMVSLSCFICNIQTCNTLFTTWRCAECLLQGWLRPRLLQNDHRQEITCYLGRQTYVSGHNNPTHLQLLTRFGCCQTWSQCSVRP
jgi:hypothetical protein